MFHLVIPFCSLGPPMPGFLAALSFSALRLVTAEKACTVSAFSTSVRTSVAASNPCAVESVLFCWVGENQKPESKLCYSTTTTYLDCYIKWVDLNNLPNVSREMKYWHQIIMYLWNVWKLNTGSLYCILWCHIPTILHKTQQWAYPSNLYHLKLGIINLNISLLIEHICFII